MVKLNKIYTRTGDKGSTGLGDGQRVPKASLRVNVMGTVDEANGVIGVARIEATGLFEAAAGQMLLRIQNDLFDLGADLCMPGEDKPEDVRLRITPAQVKRLEKEIDAMNADLTPLTSFILPGGAPAAAHLHLARSVVRRAERDCWALAGDDHVNGPVLQYLNRLSDHLFVMARWINLKTGAGDVLWKPGGDR
ncbi:MAG TPA: cob(I)yrinic acid a,c-diamide adenosyltransferase [Alphaproteobacteria bacterium]|jgi:cob(I)alamin adenosyltransferase|nr:cob(I)yrinic acid a,c-diamide adenosyltransferase [Alphaproteobacteria bacterium]